MPKPWAKDVPAVCLAHAVYDLEAELQRQGGRFGVTVARSRAEMLERLADTEILVVSGLWTPEVLDRAPRLRLVQSISAGTDQYPREALAARGIRLASAQGVNANAVSEHGMALLLALMRRLPEAGVNQGARQWRGMIGDAAAREQELDGKTMVIVGLGRIGSRLARLAQAFGMTVVGIKRNLDGGPPGVALHGPDALPRLAAGADVLALTCPLTPETEGLVGADVIASLPRHAVLINVARGKVVDEAALIAALAEGRIAGAGLDCFHGEPLDAASPLWGLPNVLVTPHTAGETQFYERNVIRLLLANAAAMEAGEPLVNAIV